MIYKEYIFILRRLGCLEYVYCILGGKKLGNKELDLEWVELIKQALDAGISKEEIRKYLQSQSQEISTGYNMV